MRGSVIMPVMGRVEATKRSVRWFLEQSIADELELIVVDDYDGKTEEAVSGLWENHNVFYHRAPPGTKTGGKRNLGILNAETDDLIMWDDDDWQGPQRCERQLEILVDTQTPFTCISPLVFYLVEDRTCWLPIDARYACGATYAFKRYVWSSVGGYVNEDLVDDRTFVEQVRKVGNLRIHKIAMPTDFVYVRHPGSTYRNRHPGGSDKFISINPPVKFLEVEHEFLEGQGSLL